MVEQQKRRLEGAISDMIEDMYRTHLRRMQVNLLSYHMSVHSNPYPFFCPVHNASLRRRLL